MESKYEPTNDEIVSAMVYRTINSVKEFTPPFVKAAAKTIIAPYIGITTYKHLKKEFNSPNEDMPKAKEMGKGFGVVAGILADFGQMFFYFHAIESGNPELLLIPAGTNTLDGIVQIGKYYVDNTREFLKKRRAKIEQAETSVSKTLDDSV